MQEASKSVLLLREDGDQLTSREDLLNDHNLSRSEIVVEMRLNLLAKQTPFLDLSLDQKSYELLIGELLVNLLKCFL